MRICYLKSLLFFIFFFSLKSGAVPAYPYPVKYLQPDGSEITVLLKGDEKVHWAETTDGYTLLSNGKSGWEYAITDNAGNLKTSGILAREINKRTSEEKTLIKKLSKNLRFSSTQVTVLKSAWEAKFGSDKLIGNTSFIKPLSQVDDRRRVFSPNGSKKLLMILIQYPDVPFTFSRQNFYDLMNTQDYNLNGASGSVKQFFYEISYGQFTVNTDIAPSIYTADYNAEYYGAPNVITGAHDSNAAALMKEACDKADADGVDFSQYDNDGDGSVDGVYIIYAGYGEASGGSVNTIWPHAGGISGKTYDGKSVSLYSCSNELNYNGPSTPGTLTTIGVICHEFGHVCGAPDYYDTNYSTDGQFSGTGNWDLMDVGLYNRSVPGAQSGNKPAHFNPFEKIRAGWLTPVTLNSAAIISDMPDIRDYPLVYKINTTTTDEYYLLENRQQTGFNAGCPGHGLMIYHYSKKQWDISANRAAPQGFYPVCASASVSPTLSSGSTGYGTISSAGCPFPGSSSKTSFTDNTTPTAKSWAGNNTYKPITNITENSSTISFKFMGGGECTPPETQASAVSATDIQENQLTLHWTRGSGDQVIILARRNSAVNTSPLNGTAFSANSSFGAGDLVDPGTYVVYNGTGTSATITDLLKNSTYHFALFEYNSASNCYLTPALSFNAVTTGCSPCIPTSSSKGSWGITNIQFNTINNSSKSSEIAYNDYAEIATELTKGTAYTLSVKTYTYVNTGYTKAWIDWNNDCEFQSGEEYDLGASTNDATVTKSITVPYNVTPGNKTLRIRTRLSTSPTACGDIIGSEAEDYTLKIVNNSATPATQVSNLTASDIQQEQIKLNWTRGNGEKVLIIAKSGTAVDALLTGESFTANAEFGAGTQIGTGNFVVYAGTNNTVTVTGLLPGTSYYFEAYEYNPDNNSYLTPALTGSFTTASACTYCTPTSANPWYGLANVTFGSINNSSSYKQGYADYSKSIYTDMIKGQTYNLSVTVSSSTYTFKTKAWIDWNQDCVFDAATEEYDLGTNTTSGLTSLSPLAITIPETALTGVTTIRISTKYSSVPAACGENSYGESEDYALNIKNVTTTWDGSAWSNSTPTALHNVVINGTYNASGFTCNNLTVNADKQLTISSGSLIVNGRITLMSDETGTATLVNKGDVNTGIKGSVEQYLAASRNWYVSSPVSNATVPAGYTCYLYREPGDNTGFTSPATAYWKKVNAGEEFTPGSGYIASPVNNGLTLSFSTGSTGHINDGEISVPLTKTTLAAKPGYNLIGNPYPSYLHVVPAINANAAVTKTVWYRTRSTGGTPAYYFETVNITSGLGTNNAGTGTVTGFIPPMQGFWVKTNQETSLVFNNNHRYHALIPDVTTTPLKSPGKSNSEISLLRLHVSNGINSDEAIISFDINASDGFDTYDSEKMTNNNSDIPEIYTLADAKELVINGMKSCYATLEIPVGFRTAKAGDFTISTSEISNFKDEILICLRNNHTGETQVLSENPVLTFSSQATDDDAMFSLIFRSKETATKLGNNLSEDYYIFANQHHQIVVNGLNSSATNQLTICNVLGQVVTNMTVSDSKAIIDVPVSGVYVVTVNGFTQKVIVK